MNKDKKWLAAGFVVFIVLFLSLPHVFRLSQHNSSLIGKETHELLWDAVLLRSDLVVDPLSGEYGDRNVISFFIAGLSRLFPLELVARFLPLVLGVCAGLLFLALLSYFRLSRNERIAIMCILVLSPAFIFLFSTVTKYSLILVMSLLSLYLLARRGFFLSSLTAGVVVMEDWVSGLILVVMLLVFSSGRYLEKGLRNRFFLRLLPVLFMAGIVGFWFLDWELVAAWRIPVVDFGSVFGFDVPLLVLGGIGVFSVWKKTYLPVNLGFLVFVFASFFLRSAIGFSLLLLAYFAGAFIARLWSRSWEIRHLKMLTLLLICCSFLFSSLAYVHRLADEPPSPDLVRAIRQIPPDAKMVASHESYYPYIHYYAMKRTYDGNESSWLFMSRDLRETELFLSRAGIDTFFVTSSMRRGLVWTADEAGLDFLLKNSRRFILVYSFQDDGESYEIWQYRSELPKKVS